MTLYFLSSFKIKQRKNKFIPKMNMSFIHLLALVFMPVEKRVTVSGVFSALVGSVKVLHCKS